MSGSRTPDWEFRARFRRHAFGWRSQPAIARIKEAVAEIKAAARRDPVRAAEGAVVFLEKLSPAILHVDSSSGSIGTAVNRAIDALVPIIAKAPAADELREGWLERLWNACEDDEIPYLESLRAHWGLLCGSAEVASRWADSLLESCRLNWSTNVGTGRFFAATTNCLSALWAAGRHADILGLLELAPHSLWTHTQFGVRALAAMGKADEAIRYAEEGSGSYDSPVAIARACEEVLLSAGRVDDAYRRYGLLANQAQTYLAWFRSVVKKYPHKEPAAILDDLVRFTPGDEGKWFAAAKDAELFDAAIALANRAPCSPQTLTRAARDFAVEKPEFAVDCGLAALRWLVEGYGYDVTGLDVHNAHDFTMRSAANAGSVAATRERVRALVARETFGERFVTKILGRELGLK